MKLTVSFWLGLISAGCEAADNGNKPCKKLQQNCCVGLVGGDGRLAYKPHAGIKLTGLATRDTDNLSFRPEGMTFNSVETSVNPESAAKKYLPGYFDVSGRVHYTIVGGEIYIILCAYDSTNDFHLYLSTD